MIKRKVAIFRDIFGMAICGLSALGCYKSAYTRLQCWISKLLGSWGLLFSSVLVLNPVNQLTEKSYKHVSHNKEFYEWRLPLPLGSI